MSGKKNLPGPIDVQGFNLGNTSDVTCNFFQLSGTLLRYSQDPSTFWHPWEAYCAEPNHTENPEVIARRRQRRSLHPTLGLLPELG